MKITFLQNAMSLMMRLKRDQLESLFIKHNRKVFEQFHNKREDGPIVLMELSSMHSGHISFSYLANVLARENKAQIIGYTPRIHSRWWKNVAMKIADVFGIAHLGVYQSFGAKNLMSIQISRSQKRRAYSIYEAVASHLDDKWDIEAIKINGIWVGDLIYDTYLRRFNKPTVEMTNRKFQDFLLESIELFVFWEDFLDNHKVCAINVTHCVYNVAIPLRLGVARNIPVFQANLTHLYRMDEDNLFAYNDFYFFKEQFAALPEELRAIGIKEAKSRIERRFAGEVGVDMFYSSKSAYTDSHHARLLRISPRKKILIATHCFFDSPHSYGNNLFADFYEWLDFLGNMTAETDYDWYIKTHPDYVKGTMEIIESFIDKYSKLTLLPADASHHQIIAEGIDLALTVHGTIGFEYAALGIPVLNCSLNNPHIAYNFNLHARDVQDYRRLLLDLNTFDFKIDKRQVYEYYFMQFIYNTEDLFFDSYKNVIEEIGGYSEQFTSAIYGKWLEEWSPNKHRAIVSAVKAFIRSGDFRMDCRHHDHEPSAERISVKT